MYRLLGLFAAVVIYRRSPGYAPPADVYTGRGGYGGSRGGNYR